MPYNRPEVLPEEQFRRPGRIVGPVGATLLLLVVLAVPGCAPPLVDPGYDGLESPLADRGLMDIQRDAIIHRLVMRWLHEETTADTRRGIQVDVFKGVVLFTGRITADLDRDRLMTYTSRLPRVRRVHDELRIGEPLSIGARSQDRLLGISLIGLITTSKEIPEGFTRGRIRIIVDEQRVFLMGAVTRAEGVALASVTRTQRGAEEVILLFDYLDDLPVTETAPAI